MDIRDYVSDETAHALVADSLTRQTSKSTTSDDQGRCILCGHFEDEGEGHYGDCRYNPVTFGDADDSDDFPAPVRGGWGWCED